MLGIIYPESHKPTGSQEITRCGGPGTSQPALEKSAEMPSGSSTHPPTVCLLLTAPLQTDGAGSSSALHSQTRQSHSGTHNTTPPHTNPAFRLLTQEGAPAVLHLLPWCRPAQPLLSSALPTSLTATSVQLYSVCHQGAELLATVQRHWHILGSDKDLT